MRDWETYVNNDEQEILVQLAIMHAQFEIIHPFIDGNGRLGRILISIFLFQKQYLKKPVFYLSEYLEANRLAYYRALLSISQNNDWQGWVEFFLKAVAEQSTINMLKAEKIINLYNDMKKNFSDATKSRYAINILDTLFKKPIINLTMLLSDSGVFNLLLQWIHKQLLA